VAEVTNGRGHEVWKPAAARAACGIGMLSSVGELGGPRRSVQAVFEATNPRIDPIFCYRAAGWDRQFWELILGRQLGKCRITHSILKGDGFCAWDFDLS